MTLTLINNNGGGYSDRIFVRDGIRVRELFEEKMGGEHARDYLIRVNRQPAEADQVLQENDRVSITPVKIEGAIAS